MQAPGGPEEDPTGGFKFGGWVAPLADVDPVFGEEIGKLFGEPFDLLLGRRTYDIFAAHWPYAKGGPYDDIAKTFNRITKYVATRKGVDLTWKGSVALRDAAKDVAKLKQEDGPALVTQGSTELVHALPAAGLIAATYMRDGEVKTATVSGANQPSAAELARREKLKRES
jgi:dihydrofolate reductase